MKRVRRIDAGNVHPMLPNLQREDGAALTVCPESKDGEELPHICILR
jgi:hypothetical protein